MNALDVPTVWLGPHSLPGADLCSFLTEGSQILLLECTIGKVREKASQIIRALRAFRTMCPEVQCAGAVVTTQKIGEADRKDLSVDGVIVLDIDSLAKLRELAREGKYPRTVSDLLGPAALGISW